MVPACKFNDSHYDGRLGNTLGIMLLRVFLPLAVADPGGGGGAGRRAPHLFRQIV